jgi:hypothetical protein
MSIFSYNVSTDLQMAQLHQAQIRREFQQIAESRHAASEAPETAQRRFRLMYRIRHWVYRLAPRMARTFL